MARSPGVILLVRKFLAARDVGQQLLKRGDQVGVTGRADVVAVEALELCEIEARWRTPDLWQVESRNHFLGSEYLLIAMRPTEPHQVISHCRGQVSHGPISVDAKSPVSL